MPPHPDGPYILGVSASHNGAACLLRGETIVAAVQEERLSRRKRHVLRGAAPSLAVRYCLDAAGIGPERLDLVVFSSATSVAEPHNDIRRNPDLRLAERGAPVEILSHHLAHAASAYALSGFADAAVLVIDGAGSPVEDLAPEERARLVGPVAPGARESFSLYAASGARLEPVEKHLGGGLDPLDCWLTAGMPVFRSLGSMYSAVAHQIFGDSLEAGKVMGLAPYGTPGFAPADFFACAGGRFTFRDVVPRRFQHKDRWPARRREYEDLAASVQRALEVAILDVVARCRALCPSERLAYAGGVALNSVANERVVAESGYRSVFVVPAAEDSGPAVGAAYWGLWRLTGENTRVRLEQDAVGRPYTLSDIDAAARGTPAIEPVDTGDCIDTAARLLAGGALLGWFQGRSELGPRALGQRSILCDPRRPDAKDVLNRRVKFREAFRPYAPAILRDEVAAWAELAPHDLDSPFMLRVCRFRPDKAPLVPGVVHVDGSARVQTVTEAANPPLYRLLQAFRALTGVPILINTSFNVAGEPIVETPEDALFCLLFTGLDHCVLEDRVVRKSPRLQSVLDLHPVRRVASIRAAGGRAGDFVFERVTRWGTVEERLPADLMPILELADGARDGHALGRALAARGAPLEAPDLVRALGALRRAGALSFAAAPAP